MTRLYGVVLGLLMVVVSMSGCGGPQELTINFKGMVGDKAFSCSETYTDIGVNKTSFQPADFRFYISNVRLVTTDDKEVALTLTADEKWQYKNVAMLDFEDKTGACEQGTPEMNSVVKGTVDGAYTYKAIKFDLGIPFDLNHQDVTKAPAPLNQTPLFWSWQLGYRFLKIDLKVEGLEKGFRMHLGSTGCQGEKENVTGCNEPNRVEITLNNFDPTKNAIVFDLAKLFANSEIDKNTKDTSPGCMSFTEDPDCAPLFKNLGLKYESKETDPSTQTAFGVVAQ